MNRSHRVGAPAPAGGPARILGLALCVVLTLSGCSFDGLNSLPLPGALGRGPDAVTYHVQVANVGTLEPNSPVLVGDVVVGSVAAMAVRDWRAQVEISVEPGVVVPANAVASVGQTSLLGSMHLALNPPVGQSPHGRLQPGATIVLNRSSTYPTTEQTLSALSVVVNGGGLGQVGELVTEFNAALGGREADVRDLLTRLNRFVGMLDGQRDDINAGIGALNRISTAAADRNEVVSSALRRIPPALAVLTEERPRITEALEKLRVLADTATGLVHDTQDDLVRNLQNLQPTVKALADVGPDLMTAITYATHFPYTQEFIDRAIRGDYINQFVVFDLTIPRLKRSLFLGTRWGQEHATLVPAPGDPYFLNYTVDPLQAPITAPQVDVATPPAVVEPAAGGN